VRIVHPRLLAAFAVAALGAGIAGCGDEESPPDDAGADFTAALEAIMSDQVDPAGIQSIDAYTNLAQGNPDVEGELDDVGGAGEELAAAEEAVAALDPPEAAAVPTEELAARIGLLADRLTSEGSTDSVRDPLIAVENTGLDFDRVKNRADQAIEAAEASSS
jgi:hypothetical protein